MWRQWFKSGGANLTVNSRNISPPVLPVCKFAQISARICRAHSLPGRLLSIALPPRWPLTVAGWHAWAHRLTDILLRMTEAVDRKDQARDLNTKPIKQLDSEGGIADAGRVPSPARKSTPTGWYTCCATINNWYHLFLIFVIDDPRF